MTTSEQFFQHVAAGEVQAVRSALSANPALANAVQEGMWPMEVALKRAKEPGVLECARELVNYTDMAWLKKAQWSGFDPLMSAVQDGNAELVEFLLPYTSANVFDDRGQTPLMWAADTGDLKMAKLLLGASNPMLVDQETGKTALMLGVVAGRSRREKDTTKQMVSLLLPVSNQDQRCKRNQTALMHAAVHVNAPVLQQLLSHNAQHPERNRQNACNEQGEDAILLVMENNFVRDVPKAECVRALKPFCNPSATDPETGRTALMIAAGFGEMECVETLIDFCDPKHQDRKGRTALMDAAMRTPALFDLVLSVSDPQARTKTGRQTVLLQVLSQLEYQLAFNPLKKGQAVSTGGTVGIACGGGSQDRLETLQPFFHCINRLCLVEPDLKKVKQAAKRLEELGVDLEASTPQLFARLEREKLHSTVKRSARSTPKTSDESSQCKGEKRRVARL